MKKLDRAVPMALQGRAWNGSCKHSTTLATTVTRPQCPSSTDWQFLTVCQWTMPTPSIPIIPNVTNRTMPRGLMPARSSSTMPISATHRPRNLRCPSSSPARAQRFRTKFSSPTTASPADQPSARSVLRAWVSPPWTSVWHNSRCTPLASCVAQLILCFSPKR